MEYEEFLAHAAENSAMSEETAAMLTRAMLTTLAERTGGEAQDLPAQYARTTGVAM